MKEEKKHREIKISQNKINNAYTVILNFNPISDDFSGPKVKLNEIMVDLNHDIGFKIELNALANSFLSPK